MRACYIFIRTVDEFSHLVEDGGMSIFVTGVTGNIGNRVVRGLAARGEQVRASSRNPERANVPDGVELVRADLADPISLRTDLAGTHTVFLYGEPDHIEDFTHVATEAGVRRVVYLSSASVEEHPEDGIGTRHAAVEQALRDSELDSTALRPGMFASNVAGWAHSIAAESVVRLPYGQAGLAPVHPDDIADTAIAALTGTLTDPTIRLSGPETLTQRRMAELIGEELGKPVDFVEISEEAFAESAPMPEFVVRSLLSYWSTAVNRPDSCEYTIERVTGARPRTFSQWVQENRELFTQ